MSNRPRQKIRLLERHRQWELRLQDKSADHDCDELERGLQRAGRLVFSAISMAMQTAGEQLESYALAHDGPRPSPDVWGTLGARDRMLTPRTYSQHLVQRVEAAMSAGGDTLVTNAVTVKGVANVGPDSSLIFVFVPMTNFFTQPDIAYTMTDLTSRIFVPADLEGALVPRRSLEPEPEEEKPPSESYEEEEEKTLIEEEEEKPPSEHSEEEKPPSEHSEEEKPPSEHSEEEKPPSEHSEEEIPPSEPPVEEEPPSEPPVEEEPPPEPPVEEEPPPEPPVVEEPPPEPPVVEELPPEPPVVEKPPPEPPVVEKPPPEPPVVKKPPPEPAKADDDAERRRREAEDERKRLEEEEEERRRRAAEEAMEQEAYEEAPVKTDSQTQTEPKTSRKGKKVTVVYTETKKSSPRSPSPGRPKAAVLPGAAGSKSPDRSPKVTVNLTARASPAGASPKQSTPSPPGTVSFMSPTCEQKRVVSRRPHTTAPEQVVSGRQPTSPERVVSGRQPTSPERVVSPRPSISPTSAPVTVTLTSRAGQPGASSRHSTSSPPRTVSPRPPASAPERIVSSRPSTSPTSKPVTVILTSRSGQPGASPRHSTSSPPRTVSPRQPTSAPERIVSPRPPKTAPEQVVSIRLPTSPERVASSRPSTSPKQAPVTVTLTTRAQPGASSRHSTPSPPGTFSPRPPTSAPKRTVSPRPPTPGSAGTISPTQATPKPTAVSPKIDTPGPAVSLQQIILEAATPSEQLTQDEVGALLSSVRSPSPGLSPDQPSTSSVITEDHIFMTSTSASPRSTIVEKFDIKYIREEIFDGSENRLGASDNACVDFHTRRSNRSQSLSPHLVAGQKSSRKSSETRSASSGRRHRSPSHSPPYSPTSSKTKSSYSVSQRSNKSHSRTPSLRSPDDQFSPKIFFSKESQVSDTCQANDIDANLRSRPASALESVETNRSNSRSQSPLSEGHGDVNPIISYSAGSLISSWWMDETQGRESPSKSPSRSITPSRKTDGYSDNISELVSEEGEYLSPPVSPISHSSVTAKTTPKEFSAFDEGTLFSSRQGDSQKDALTESERGSRVHAVSPEERTQRSLTAVSDKIQSPLADGYVELSYPSDSEEQFEDSSGILERIEDVTPETLSPTYSDKESCTLQSGSPRSPTAHSVFGDCKTGDLQLNNTSKAVKSPSLSRQHAYRIQTSTRPDFEVEKVNICDKHLTEEQPLLVSGEAMSVLRQFSSEMKVPPNMQETEACPLPISEVTQPAVSSKSRGVETAANEVKILATLSSPDKITPVSPIVEEVEKAVLQLKMDTISSIEGSPNLDEIRRAISPAMKEVERAVLQLKLERLSPTLKSIEEALSPTLLERDISLSSLKIKTGIPVSPQHVQIETSLSPNLFSAETSPVAFVLQTTTPPTVPESETTTSTTIFREIEVSHVFSTETNDSVSQSTHEAASHLESASPSTVLFREPTPDPAVSPLQTASEAAFSLKKFTPESSVSSRQSTPVEQSETKLSPTVGDETSSPPGSILEAFSGLGSQILEYFKNSYFKEQSMFLRPLSSPSASEVSADVDQCIVMDEIMDKVGETQAEQTHLEKKVVELETLSPVLPEEVLSFSSSRASQKSRDSPCQIEPLSPTIESSKTRMTASYSSVERDSPRKTSPGNTEEKHLSQLIEIRSTKTASSSSSITSSESNITASTISTLSPTSSPPEEKGKQTPLGPSGSYVQRSPESLAAAVSASQQPIGSQQTSRHSQTSPLEALSCADLQPSSLLPGSREKIRSASAQLTDVSSQRLPRSYSPASSVETSPRRLDARRTSLSPRITILLSELRAALSSEPEKSNDNIVFSSSAGTSPRRSSPVSLYKERVPATTSPKSMAELLAAQRKKAKADQNVRATSSTQTKRTVSEGLKTLVAAQRKYASSKSQQHSNSESKELIKPSKNGALEQITPPRGMLLLPHEHVSTSVEERLVAHDDMLPSTVTITTKKVTYTAEPLPKSPADSVGMISPPRILSYPTALPISLPQPVPISSGESAQWIASSHESPRSRGSPISRRCSEPTHHTSPIIAPQEQTAPVSHLVSTIPSSFSSFRMLRPASAPTADPRFTEQNTRIVTADQRSPAFSHFSEYRRHEILGATTGIVSKDNVHSVNEKRKKASKISGWPQKSVGAPNPSEFITVFDERQNNMEATSHGRIRHLAVSRDRKTNSEEMLALQKGWHHHTSKERRKKTQARTETGHASLFRHTEPDPKGISSDSSEDFSMFVSKLLNDGQEKHRSPQPFPTSHTAPLSPGKRRIPDALERQRLLDERRKRNRTLCGPLRATLSSPSATPRTTSAVQGRTSSIRKSPSINPGSILDFVDSTISRTSAKKSPKTNPGSRRNMDSPVFQETPPPLSQQLQSYRHRQGLVGDSAERFSFSKVRTSSTSQPFTSPSIDITPDQYKQIRRVSWNDDYRKLRHIYQNRSGNQNSTDVPENLNNAQDMNGNGSRTGRYHNATWNVNSNTSCLDFAAVGSFTSHSGSQECCRVHSRCEPDIEKCANNDYEEITGTYSCKAGILCKENEDILSSDIAAWECDTNESSKEGANWQNSMLEASRTEHLTRRLVKQTQQECQENMEKLQTDTVEPERACSSSAKYGKVRESEGTRKEAANQQNVMPEATKTDHIKRRLLQEHQRRKEGMKSTQADHRFQSELADCLTDSTTRRFVEGFESHQTDRVRPELPGSSFSNYDPSTEREQTTTESGSRQNVIPDASRPDQVTRRFVKEIHQRREYKQKCHEHVAVAVEDRHQLQEVLARKDHHTTSLKTLQSQSRHLTIKHKQKIISMKEERSHTEEYIIKSKQGTLQNRERSDSQTGSSSRHQVDRHQAGTVHPKLAGSLSGEHGQTRDDKASLDSFRHRMGQQHMRDISKHKDHEPLSLSEELRNAGWSPEPHLGTLKNNCHNANSLERNCSDKGQTKSVLTCEDTDEHASGSCSGKDFQNFNSSANPSFTNDSPMQDLSRKIVDKKLHTGDAEGFFSEQESLHNVYEDVMKMNNSYISYNEDKQDVVGLLDGNVEWDVGSEIRKEINSSAGDEYTVVCEWNQPNVGDHFPQISKHLSDEDSETQHESMLLHQHSEQWDVHNINNSGNDESQTAHTPTVQAGKKNMLRTLYENKMDNLGWSREEHAGAAGGQSPKEETERPETKGMLKTFPGIRNTVLRKRRSFGRSYLAKLLARQRRSEGELATDCDQIQKTFCRTQSNDYTSESDFQILTRESIPCEAEEGGDTDEVANSHQALESLESNFTGKSREQFKGLFFNKDQLRGECTCSMDASDALPLMSQRRLGNLKVHFENNAAVVPCFDQTSFIHDECQSNDADGTESDYEPGEVLHYASTCSCDCSAPSEHGAQIQTSSFFGDQIGSETGVTVLCAECGKWNLDGISGRHKESDESTKSFNNIEDETTGRKVQTSDVDVNRQMDCSQDVNVLPSRLFVYPEESDHFHHANSASPPGTTATSSPETGLFSSHSVVTDPTEDNADVIVSNSMIQAYGYNPMTESPFMARGYPELHQEIASLDHISVSFVKRKALAFLKDEKEEFVEVGRGTYGCVYLAQAATRRGPTKVVVKDFFTDSTSWDLIIHEARMLCYLQDTGVIPYFYGLLKRRSMADDFSLIQQYFGQGKTLHTVIINKEPLPSMVWQDIAWQLARGLLLIHERHVLLNDLKGDNVLIDLLRERKVIKYIDFGMATFRKGLNFHLPKDQMSKFNFLAPEVRAGAFTSPMSDVFSLGYLLDQINRLARLEILRCLSAGCMESIPADRLHLPDVVDTLELHSHDLDGVCYAAAAGGEPSFKAASASQTDRKLKPLLV